MKKRIGLVLFVAACGSDGMMTGGDDGGGGDDVIDPPGMLSPLERCIVDGGSIKELWSVGNQHGPVTSIVAGSLVVLGGQDGSVKQWTVDGDEPQYGTPFTTAGATVAAMALSANHITAATAQGQVAEWTLADAAPSRTTTIADVELSALAVSDDAARAITGTTSGELFLVERGAPAMTKLTSTMWGVRSIGFAAGNRLYTAGHWYGTPQLERRAADSPVEAPDVWNDQGRTGHVTAVATDAEATRLVAAGERFVATFAPDNVAAGPLAISDLEDHAAVGAVLLPGGKLFVTAGSEGTLRVWDAGTAQPVSTLSIPAPIGIAADTAGTRLFTSGVDGRLHAFGCE